MYAGDFPQDLSNPPRQPCPCQHRLVCFHSRPAELGIGAEGEKNEKEILHFFAQIAFLVHLFFWNNPPLFGSVAVPMLIPALTSVVPSPPSFSLRSIRSFSPSLNFFLNPSCLFQLPAGLFFFCLRVTFFPPVFLSNGVWNEGIRASCMTQMWLNASTNQSAASPLHLIVTKA